MVLVVKLGPAKILGVRVFDDVTNLFTGNACFQVLGKS